MLLVVSTLTFVDSPCKSVQDLNKEIAAMKIGLGIEKPYEKYDTIFPDRLIKKKKFLTG